MKVTLSAIVAGAALLSIAPTAFGQSFTAKVAEPASYMIFPLFDSRPATSTIINVTNTNTDRTVCQDNDNLRVGDVRAHYIYYGASAEAVEDGSAHWLEFDRFEDLTPGDTLSVLASDHNPEGEIGFLTVAAQSPDEGLKIDFDYLIGSAYIANSDLDILYCYLPYGFEANFEADEISSCGWPMEDDSQAEFGLEGDDYAFFPDVLYIDSFFEENPGVFDNKLTLMSTSGQDYINEVDFLFWNNKEDRFSRTFKFVCWTSVPLSEISAVAANLNGDPDEFVKETGWARIDGRRILDLSGNPVTLQFDDGFFSDSPSLLGVFQQSVRIDFVAGHELHFSGTQDALLPN